MPSRSRASFIPLWATRNMGGGLARIPSHHRATTVRSKPQMPPERGRKIQRQLSPTNAFRRTLYRISKRIIIIFEGSYVSPDYIASSPCGSGGQATGLDGLH